MNTADMTAKMAAGNGFIAALDQSGGSTPKGPDPRDAGADHQVAGLQRRQGGGGDPVRADDGPHHRRDSDGDLPVGKARRGAVPEDRQGVGGRSGRRAADEVVAQQFDVGRRILDRGLVPIIEPEVDIKSATKAEAEKILRDELLAELDRQPASQPVMLKLTLPSEANFYANLVAHPSVLRVVALSGGYSREESNKMLAMNKGVIASFSRALTEGLSAQQSEADFERTLDATIEGIYQASLT